MPTAAPIPILYEDANLVAVAKPAGVASVPGDGEKTSVLRIVAEQMGVGYRGETEPRLRPVHRLDKDTSGLLLIAKDKPTQKYITEQFAAGAITKEYLALVTGEVREQSGTVDAPLRRDPGNPIKMQISKAGKPSQTDWKLMQRFRNFALLRAFPKTGRTHQIRVHLASIGFPLVIDPLYGRKPKVPEPGAEIGLYLSTFKRGYRPTSGEEERPLISRLTLHAEVLRFVLPSGRAMELTCQAPKDLRATINQLTKYAS
jgi:23S rRNA pseudouridine1911/1915/1917 synthase